MTQAKKICRLGRGQSIGSRCDKFNAPPPQVSEASWSNQPFNAVNGRGLSDTHRPWQSKLRRGRVEFIAPWTYWLPPSQPTNFLSLCHIRDRSNFSQLLPRGGTDLMGPQNEWSARWCHRYLRWYWPVGVFSILRVHLVSVIKCRRELSAWRRRIGDPGDTCLPLS